MLKNHEHEGGSNLQEFNLTIRSRKASDLSSCDVTSSLVDESKDFVAAEHDSISSAVREFETLRAMDKINGDNLQKNGDFILANRVLSVVLAYMDSELIRDGDNDYFITLQEIQQSFDRYCLNQNIQPGRYRSSYVMNFITTFCHIGYWDYPVRRKHAPMEEKIQIVVVGVKFKNPMKQYELLSKRAPKNLEFGSPCGPGVVLIPANDVEFEDE